MQKSLAVLFGSLKQWIIYIWVAHASAQKITEITQSSEKSVTYLALMVFILIVCRRTEMTHQQRVHCSLSAVIERTVGEWRQRPPLAFVLEEDILLQWRWGDVTRVNFRKIGLIAVRPRPTRVCVYSISYFWADACFTQYEFVVVNGQTTTSDFHKVA